jgi:hypothetical protein
LFVSAEISRTGDGYETLRARASAIGAWERFGTAAIAPPGSPAADAAAAWAKAQVNTYLDPGLCLTFVFAAWSNGAGVNLRQWVNVPIGSSTYPQDIWGHFTHGTTGSGTAPHAGALVFYRSTTGDRTLSHVVVDIGNGQLVSTQDGLNESGIVHIETYAQRAYSIEQGWWLPE